MSAACLGKVVAISFMLATGSIVAAAQAQGDGCGAPAPAETGPARQVLTCRDGLTITIEGGATFAFAARARSGQPESAKLDAKAILIETPPKRRNFQILTPHAIATVRGTVWAVDVSAERTSVFVKRGRVAVRRPGGKSVVLAEGDGVDVASDKPGTPLEVKRWGAPRIAALMARFGQ